MTNGRQRAFSSGTTTATPEPRSELDGKVRVYPVKGSAFAQRFNAQKVRVVEEKAPILADGNAVRGRRRG